MKTGTGIAGLMLAVAVASSGCAAVGASMHVSGRLAATAARPAACEIGPGALPTAVRWTPAQRQALESVARSGLVVVASDGCHVRVLDGCRARGAYTYVGVPLQTDRRELSSGAGLGGGVAILGSSLGGNAGNNSHYALDVAITGSYRADRGVVRVDELEGACAGATHVVASYDAGAFVLTHSDGFHAGASTGSASTTGISGYSGADESEVTQGGQLAACYQPASGAAPISGCSAAVDVHVAQLAPALPPVPQAAPQAAPTPLQPPTLAQRCSAGESMACMVVAAKQLGQLVPPGMVSSR